MLDLKKTKKELQRFAHEIVRKTNNRVDFNLQVHKNSFSLKFLMEPYREFQDRGVKGVKSGKSLGSHDGAIKAFSYKRKGGANSLKGMPPPRAFDKWNIKKGREARDEKGRFLPRKQLNFKTALGIFYFGIKPSLFFTKPFDKAFKPLSKELIEAFGLDVEQLLKFTRK